MSIVSWSIVWFRHPFRDRLDPSESPAGFIHIRNSYNGVPLFLDNQVRDRKSAELSDPSVAES